MRVERVSGDTFLLVFELPGGGRREVLVRSVDGILETPWGSYSIDDLLARQRPSGGGGGAAGGGSWLVEVRGGEVVARLPVRVVEVHRRAGERVAAGETVVVVETMKMLNEVPAPCGGRLVWVAEPGPVAAGRPLLRVDCGGGGEA